MVDGTKRYTVRELTRELENWDGDSIVVAISECHGCGGSQIEVDGYVDGHGEKFVTITGSGDHDY